MTSRALNLVANAAAQSADHVSSYFTMLRAELEFYVSCLNLRDRLDRCADTACRLRLGSNHWRLSRGYRRVPPPHLPPRLPRLSLSR